MIRCASAAAAVLAPTILGIANAQKPHSAAVLALVAHRPQAVGAAAGLVALAVRAVEVVGRARPSYLVAWAEAAC